MTVWERGWKSHADEIECVRFNFGELMRPILLLDCTQIRLLGRVTGLRDWEWWGWEGGCGPQRFRWAQFGLVAASAEELHICFMIKSEISGGNCLVLLNSSHADVCWPRWFFTSLVDLLICGSAGHFLSGLSLRTSCSDDSKLSYALSGTIPKINIVLKWNIPFPSSFLSCLINDTNFSSNSLNAADHQVALTKWPFFPLIPQLPDLRGVEPSEWNHRSTDVCKMFSFFSVSCRLSPVAKSH